MYTYKGKKDRTLLKSKRIFHLHPSINKRKRVFRKMGDNRISKKNKKIKKSNFHKTEDICGTYRLTKLFFAIRARSVPSNDNDLLAEAKKER